MYNLIEDYLDRLLLPMVHRVPYHERQHIRQEIRDHLMERTQELQAQGASADEAVPLAIKQFGQAEWVGTLLLEKYSPLPVLNWWRALLLAVVVMVTVITLAYLVALTHTRMYPQQDDRQQKVVDVMLWTVGKAITQGDIYQQLWGALNPSPAPVLSLPPGSAPRLPADTSLRSVHTTVQAEYLTWLLKAARAGIPLEVHAYARRVIPEYPLPPPDVTLSRFNTLGDSVPRPTPSTPGSVPLTAGIFLLSAFAAGALMRQWRWVLVVALVALFSVAISSGITAKDISRRSVLNMALSRQLGDTIATLQNRVQSDPSLLKSSRPYIDLRQTGVSDDASRRQRIEQLVQLFRFYQRDYERMWREWQQTGFVGQSWRMLWLTVVPTWWALPCIALATVAGGWLGILFGVWGWRVRRYLALRFYRYV